MSDLWAQDDPEKWQATLDKYWEIIDAIGKEKLPELERYDLFLKNLSIIIVHGTVPIDLGKLTPNAFSSFSRLLQMVPKRTS